jgi:enterochelin esterase-like enzyme/sugar lactone lactonase YvrE
MNKSEEARGTMKRFAAVGGIALCAIVGASPGYAQIHADSTKRPGVPEGRIEGPLIWASSRIYPGTTREYWIYVPAQYDKKKPATVTIVQDGLGRAEEWKLPVVLDNLIHAGDIPVTIGIFIDPGTVPAPHFEAQPRFNRSFEYDAMGDRYARFLLEEILPDVGKRYNLSSDPNDRLVAGASSGGICAFTAAWERPDAFRRVLSTIGTYVGLRGGDEYPTLVRKTEPKPLRVFLEDGSSDLNIYAGDWWLANQAMLSAFRFAGYDVQSNWGDGGHSGAHAAEILPEALRWIWRDYPAAVLARSGAERRTTVLVTGEDWQLVSGGHGPNLGLTVATNGEVVFVDAQSGRIQEIQEDGSLSVVADGWPGSVGIAFGPDGLLYACEGERERIVRYDSVGRQETVLDEVKCTDLVGLVNAAYFTDAARGELWRLDWSGGHRVVDKAAGHATSLTASPDQTLLVTADADHRFLRSYQIQLDGGLAHGQQFGWVHRRDSALGSGAAGMAVDVEGRVYVATALGVQIFDPLGRVQFIIATPDSGRLSGVSFGGRAFDTLYVASGGKVYKRKLATTGVVPHAPPIKPPRPRL